MLKEERSRGKRLSPRGNAFFVARTLHGLHKLGVV